MEKIFADGLFFKERNPIKFPPSDDEIKMSDIPF
jgi:hypothetical protein